MTDLTPLTALGAAAPQSARFGALTLAENPGLALASLALRAGQVPPAPMGLALPGPGGWTEAGGIAAFWTGPGQWMIEGPGAAAQNLAPPDLTSPDFANDDFAARVAAAAPGCYVTEQTDGFAGFEVVSDAGPAPVEAWLSRLVNIDLGTFGPGRATRTGFDHMSVFVIRRTAGRVAVLGMRSAAGSLWHALTVAAARLEGKTK